jgi:hypothetical protein
MEIPQMKTFQPLSLCLLSTTYLGTALAQTPTAQTSESAENSTAPVAHIYVTRPTHLDAFDVSSAGRLTAVAGSPFSGIDLFHLSVSGKYLIGESDDHTHIITYAIGSDGAVKQVASIDAQSLSPHGACCDRSANACLGRAQQMTIC